MEVCFLSCTYIVSSICLLACLKLEKPSSELGKLDLNNNSAIGELSNFKAVGWLSEGLNFSIYGRPA